MATVFAEWLDKGQEDPFNGEYDGDRKYLSCPHLPCKVLALMLEPMAGTLDGIVYLTAAKERVRWLSKRLFDRSSDHAGVNRRRAELPMGNLTDYALANQFFMSENREELLAGRARIEFLLSELKSLGDNPL